MPRPTWDRQTAIDMGNKGRLARAARKALCASIEQQLPALAQDLTYSERLKARLRAQIELLLSRIDEEATKPKADGSRVDRLASALERLIEAERKADNRPLPGTLKPRSPDAPSARDSRPASVPQAPQVPSVPKANQVPQAPSVTPAPSTSLPPPPAKLQ